MDLSMIIPAYNEEDRLARTLSAIHGAFVLHPIGALKLRELIVVDDGSADRTSAVALEWTDRLPVSVIRFDRNRGKGAAVRAGMLKACSPYVLFYDADGATPLDEIPHLARVLEHQHADIAIGSRVLGPSSLVTMSAHRRLIGRVYHSLCSKLVPGIRDTACGCKLFRRDAARKLFSLQRIDRFAFDVEVLALALTYGYRVREVPVRWTAIPESRVRLIRDGAQMFWCVLRLYVARLLHPAGK